MIVELNTLIELGFLMKTWFSSLVFKCISLRIIWIIQWSLTWRVRTLVFFFTLSCMAAKCGDPLSEMNLKKRVQGVLITSCTLIWEAAVVIVFRFFFDCWSEYCGIVHGSEIVTIIIILKVNHYVFFSSFFIHLIIVNNISGKFHVIVWLLSWIPSLSWAFWWKRGLVAWFSNVYLWG